MAYKAVIFDLDGTLADTQMDLAHAMNRVLMKHEFPTFTCEAYKYMVGKGLRNLVVASLPLYAQTTSVIDTCLDEMMEDYGQNYLVDTHIYKGVSQMLDRLQEQNIPMGVISNKADFLTKKIIAELFAPWKFAYVLGLSDDFPRKPEPESALFVCEQMGVKPEEVVFVGDTGVDMELALRTGMYGLGVLWGFRTAEELHKHGAQQLIEKPDELLTLFSC